MDNLFERIERAINDLNTDDDDDIQVIESAENNGWFIECQGYPSYFVSVEPVLELTEEEDR